MKSLLFACLLGLSSVVQAEVTMSDFAKYKDNEQFKSYLSGITEGLRSANLRLGRMGQKQLFCPPKSLDYDTADYVAMIETFQEKHPLYAQPKVALGEVVVRSLIESYPCGK